MNAIFSFLIDLLGEVFLIAGTTSAAGPAFTAGPGRFRWWRRVLGAALFALLAVLPFLVMRWIGG